MGILSSRRLDEFDTPADRSVSAAKPEGHSSRGRTARILLGAMAHHPGFRHITHPSAGNEIKMLVDAAQANTQALIDAGCPGEQAAFAGFSLTAQAWSAAKAGKDVPLALADRLASYAGGLDGVPLGRPSLTEIMSKFPVSAGQRLNALHCGLLATMDGTPDLRSWFIDQVRDQSTYDDPTEAIVDALRLAQARMTPDQWIEAAFMSEESRSVLHLTLAAQAFKAGALYDDVIKKAGPDFARFALGDRAQHMTRAMDMAVKSANAVESADMAAAVDHDEMILARAMGSLMNQGMRPWFEFRYDMARIAWPHYGKEDTGALKHEVQRRGHEGLALRDAILEVARLGNPFDLATEARVRGELVMAYRAAERKGVGSLGEIPAAAGRTQHLIDAAAHAYSRSPDVPESVRGRARHHIESMLRDVAAGTIRLGRGEEIANTLVSALNVYQQLSGDDMSHAVAALRTEITQKTGAAHDQGAMAATA